MEGTASVGEAGGKCDHSAQGRGCREDRGGHAEPRRPPRTVAFPMHDWKPPRVLSRGTTYVLKGSLQLLGGEHTAGVKGRNSETS